MTYVNNTHTMRVTRSLAMSSELSGAMICVRGAAVGKMIMLPSDKRMIVGRDSSVCNYAVSGLKVSRKHLEITYIGALNKYRVVDYSSNGTFVGNHERLKKNYEYYLEPRTELKLGNSENIYKLK